MKALTLYKDVIDTHSPSPRNLKCSLCSNQLKDKLQNTGVSWNYACCANCAGINVKNRASTEPSSADSLTPRDIKNFLTEFIDEPKKKLDKTYKSLDVFQDNHQPESSQENSKLKYSSSLPVKGLYDKEFQLCSLCGVNTYRGLIYKNASCLHSYCLGCVENMMISHPGLQTCYLKNCSKQINLTEIDDFCMRCAHKERTKLQRLGTLNAKDLLNIPQDTIKDADSYLQLSVRSPNVFFLCGFLLIQDRFSQPPSPALDKITQKMINCFESVPKGDFYQRTIAKQVQQKLQELIQNVQELVVTLMSPDEGSSLDPNIRPIVGDFILNECRKDEKMEEALRHVARNTLNDYLDKYGELSQLEIIKKLTSKRWDSEEMPEDELFELFCLSSYYHLKFVTLNGIKATQRTFGHQGSKQTALILDIPHKKNFKAILYKTNW